METWLTTIASRRIRRSTLETTYAPKVRNRIIPGLGKHRLDRLTPEHIERFYTRLEADGLASATVLQIRRILSRAHQAGRDTAKWNPVERRLGPGAAPG
jgi:integrase